MRIDRQIRIWIMLGINGGFFLAEIIIGYYVNSLALVRTGTYLSLSLFNILLVVSGCRFVPYVERYAQSGHRLVGYSRTSI